MKKMFAMRILPLLLALCLLSLASLSANAEEIVPIMEGEKLLSDLGVAEGSLELNCKSAILMEATTGAVLYLQNCDEALPPASVTKIMTLLLVMEAVDAGIAHMDSIVTVSANAASMGGSQVYLKEGEQMTLEDLLKSVVIASANDAAVALAEFVAGSVSSFVERMNQRAAELGMTNTRFENVTGLDDTATVHLTSARDIAQMSRALIAHEEILKYSSIWQDSIREGAFGLTNTNRLVRFYRGCTGLKTGSTAKAGFCVSVTAEREGLSLVCVVMGAESRDVRNAIASELLDWGFANYGLYCAEGGSAGDVKAEGGVQASCVTAYPSFCCVLPKASIAGVETRLSLPTTVTAPVKAGDCIGKLEYLSGGAVIGEVPITAAYDIARIGFFDVVIRMLAKLLLI